MSEGEFFHKFETQMERRAAVADLHDGLELVIGHFLELGKRGVFDHLGWNQIQTAIYKTRDAVFKQAQRLDKQRGELQDDYFGQGGRYANGEAGRLVRRHRAAIEDGQPGMRYLR